MQAIMFAWTAQCHRTGLQRQVQPHDNKHAKDASRPRSLSLSYFGQWIQGVISQIVFVGQYIAYMPVNAHFLTLFTFWRQEWP
jgi:hypothetical protein